MPGATTTEQSARTLTLNELNEAVSGSAAAFRCRRRLQPGGGEGDKVFPPTFAGAVYAVEQRRVPGREQPVTCVLLDSVQSQANRMEQALQDALDAKAIALPIIEVDFSKAELPEAVGKITSLQAPHRLADAILRDSEHNGQPFRKSEVAQALNQATPSNATAIYNLCPTALVFGMWDSTGPKGGLGAKFERAVVSEVIGIGAESGLKTASRIDPLITKTRGIVLYRTTDGRWTLDETMAVKEKNTPQKLGKDGKVSEANLGNVTPSIAPGGVTVDYAEQITTVSLICLRRLRFPQEQHDHHATDAAGRAVLAALGLCAATLAFESGMGLRSRCLLWPEAPMEWELLAKPGEAPARYTIDGDTAKKLLTDAVAAAEQAGLAWRKEPLKLTPSEDLVKLVRLSQQQAENEDSQGS